MWLDADVVIHSDQLLPIENKSIFLCSDMPPWDYIFYI